MNRSILNAIGNTPLVGINKLNPNCRVQILAKLESANPGGSVKDRAALYMIESAERSGALTPEKTVVEATSGNTGIGLALVCSVKGYKLLLAMSEGVSIERQKILQARGAEILLTPNHLGTDGAIEEVYRLAREDPSAYFVVDQFNNAANWQAHYHGTAQEIWQQTDGSVTMFVAAMGTTGTLMGVSRRLKEFNPAIEIVGVEPYLGHKIQGLKNLKEAYCPGIYEKQRLDRKVNVDDEEAFATARRLAREEGLLVGMSSGAAVAAALREAQHLSKGTVVVILPDGGERYLSTPLYAVRGRDELTLFNTYRRKQDAFQPLKSGQVAVYTCGPAAHAPIHLDEMRRFVFADLLCRYLEYRGYRVRHVTSITDLDDKSISASEKSGIGLKEYTDAQINQFKQDLKALHIKPADHYPRASEHVENMIALAEKLAKKGFAYEKLRSLYFDISRLAQYGCLSGFDIRKVKLGATVDLDDYEKDNPRDFTLFKRARLSELRRGIFTPTEWGNVRPSWHIQCAAISMQYLGDTYDIHTGSRELVFPHHENEHAIAAAATGKPLANYWLHCERVRTDQGGGVEFEDGLTLSDLKGMGFSGRVIRYWLLSQHYRKPLCCSRSRLEDARRSLQRLDRCIQSLVQVRGKRAYPELDQILYDISHGFRCALEDDLNMPAALAGLFKAVRRINVLVRKDRLDTSGAEKIIDCFGRVDSVLNVLDFADAYRDPQIRELTRQRERAREMRNWQLADQLRDQLTSMGIIVQDHKVSQ
jgi:cysteinyl-tRNA synthetase